MNEITSGNKLGKALQRSMEHLPVQEVLPEESVDSTLSPELSQPAKPVIYRPAEHGEKQNTEQEVTQKAAPALGLTDAHWAQSHRFAALQQAGDFTLAYNTAVQENLEYFWGDAGGQTEGFIAFNHRKGNVFVLGDPVATPDRKPSLVQQFVARYPDATFCQVGTATAAILQDLGYYVNEMGVDTTLYLKDYTFGGKTKERIRYAANWLNRRDYRIIEATYDELDPAEVKSVSDQWRSQRNVKKREMRFLNRPIRFEEEPGVRKFFLLDSEQKIMAFFYFDPLYRDGKVIGYATAIKRRHPDAPLYTEQGIMKFAVEKFKEEGLEEVKLGLSPLAWIENKTYRRNPFLHFSFRYGFNAWWVNRYFYNLQGHAAYKRHFKGVEEPMHYASPVLVNDVRIASLLRLTGVY